MQTVAKLAGAGGAIGKSVRICSFVGATATVCSKDNLVGGDVMKKTNDGKKGSRGHDYTHHAGHSGHPKQSSQSGQSLVEMSFVLPMLILILFAIVDISYYIYCYGMVYSAARRASDAAAYLPPYPSRLDGTAEDDDAYDISDPCVQAIVRWAQKGAVLVDLEDIDTNRDKFTITYLEWKEVEEDGEKVMKMVPITSKGKEARQVGNSVRVTINYTVEPLTPLFGMFPFGDEGRMELRASSIRTIQGRGESLPNPDNDGVIICNP
jgi:hypothetical protein